MRQPLILNYFSLLADDESSVRAQAVNQTCRQARQKFHRAVQARYNEATLERLLSSAEVQVRQAAVLALQVQGTMNVNMPLAGCLHDDDATVRNWATQTLWSIWLRADSVENNSELARLAEMEVSAESAPTILAGFEALLRQAPRFAEAYNQRAIVFFRLGDFPRAIADCERTLRINPYHFGAASGMGQAFMKQRKYRAALRTYRRANRIHPDLDGVPETIASLERLLGGEGKRENEK